MRDLLLPARCSSQSTAVANSQAAAAVDGERVRDEDSVGPPRAANLSTWRLAASILAHLQKLE
jgi:hypothetical protein